VAASACPHQLEPWPFHSSICYVPYRPRENAWSPFGISGYQPTPGSWTDSSVLLSSDEILLLSQIYHGDF